jgi:S-DNA-T family DNA segregation ATPase FtsK/SpoIIIE
MPSASRKAASRAKPEPADQIGPADWMDRISLLETHFGRFLWDILGVALLALGLITLLGFLGLSGGQVLEAWVAVLRLWFGWGTLLAVAALGTGGLLAFRRSRQAPPFGIGQVIALELAAFLTLALLSVIGGDRLDQAESGIWGGRIGWGLATLFSRLVGPIWGGILVFLLWIAAVFSAFRIWARLEVWLLKQAGQSAALPRGSDPAARAGSEEPHLSPLAGPQAAGPATAPRKAAGSKLPAEFRKSFKVPDKQEARPASPKPRNERLPPLNILPGEQAVRPDDKTINQTAGTIEKTLAEFAIPAKVVGFRIGPTVTQFAVQPGFIKKGTEEDAQQMKVRVAQIAALQKDLALALSAERLRIEAPVPGRGYVGIEVPNPRAAMVRLRPLLETDAFYRVASPLALALGRDVSGNPILADLGRMPHLLIAGTTGSGKSVCIAGLAACLAVNNAPEDLRMVMIDSKMVELIRFNGLPHLLGKVETDIQRILGVLRWVVLEMEHRYKLLEAARARDIYVYNRQLQRRRDAQPLPRIVVLIDEMADLMMSAPDQTEHNLVRLAQMARATGIHLVVATQRPSTDVVTGLIKANFPARISFAVASQVDSRVILDLPGAETLLGRGDMLFLNPEVGSPVRLQGVMVTDQEIERLIAHWQKTVPETDGRAPWESLLAESAGEDNDDVLIEQAITLLRKERRASASMLQRRLRIGYPRAARLLDQLQEMGVVGPAMGGGRDREILIEPEESPSASSEEE